MRGRKNFFTGILLLTVSGAAVKICGLLFKIPLVSIIGEDGMGYFNSAYVIYTFFYVLTTSGLPLGMSILISGTEDPFLKRRYLHTALWSFGLLGLGICLFLMMFPNQIAQLVGNKQASSCLRVMGFTLLFVCLSGAIRGYFQGEKNMLPTAVSQVIEAVFKTALGILLAYYAVQKGKEPYETASYALFGITIGSFLSLVYLLLRLSREKSIFKKSPAWKAPKGIGKKLFSVVLPVSASSVVLSISSVLDLGMVMRRLQSIGFTPEEANRMYGNYSGLAIPLFNLPPVLIAPIAAALVPHLTSALAKKDSWKSQKLIASALKLTMLISAPCVSGLAVLSKAILCLLFQETAALTAAPYLTLLAPSILFVALFTAGSSLLQACGKRNKPMIAIAVGVIFKQISGYILIGKYGMAGAPIGTFMCYSTAALLTFCFVKKEGLLQISFSSVFFFPLLCGTLCGLAAKGTLWLVQGSGLAGQVLLPMLSGGTVYLISALLTGCVDEEVLSLLPAGGKLARIFKKIVHRKNGVKNDKSSEQTNQRAL